jgi:hypothetical protein
MRLLLLTPLLAGLAAALLLVEPPTRAAQGALGEWPEMTPYGMEYNARGEVHDAFAEPTRNEPVQGVLASKQAPAPVKEKPPEEKPEGDNLTFIPGYWSWDDETADFTWTSGFWRAAPPGRTWVPGRWQKAEGGSRWVSGYWAVAGQEKEIEYLPPPPEPKEEGPSEAAPSANHTYVAGNWVYEARRYVWRPGYWLEFRPGWVWVPACYKWTPCGYVFVPGYWDLPILERGLLFAPVRFTVRRYLEPDFVYQPSYCVQPDFLCGALFVRRGAASYYFGDYFEAKYKRSFTPWLNFRLGGVKAAIDLNFSYYKVAYREHPGWLRGLTSLYGGRYARTIAPPPRTVVQQKGLLDAFRKRKVATETVGGLGFTNLQNISALAPLSLVGRLSVTALSSLAGIPPAAARKLGVQRQSQMGKLSGRRLREETRGLVRFDALVRARQKTETSLIGKAPLAANAAPIRGKLDLPPGTPPARVVDPAGVRGLPERPKAEPPLPAGKPPVAALVDKGKGGPSDLGLRDRQPPRTGPIPGTPKPAGPPDPMGKGPSGKGPAGKEPPPKDAPGKGRLPGKPLPKPGGVADKPSTGTRPPRPTGSARLPDPKATKVPGRQPGKGPVTSGPGTRPRPNVDRPPLPKATGPIRRPEPKVVRPPVTAGPTTRPRTKVDRPASRPPVRPPVTVGPRTRPRIDRPPVTVRRTTAAPPRVSAPIRRPPAPARRLPAARPTAVRRPSVPRSVPVARPPRVAAPLRAPRPPAARTVRRVSAPRRAVTRLPSVRRPVRSPPRSAPPRRRFIR